MCDSLVDDSSARWQLSLLSSQEDQWPRRISESIGIALPFILQYFSKAVVFTNGQIESLSVETVVTEDVVEFLNIRLTLSHERSRYTWFANCVLKMNVLITKVFFFVTAQVIWWAV